jgi:LysR family transcriptional regulator, glycine cleavage system transcriptional activator
MSNFQRLPPIQYLVAFAAAAKQCSFKLAAEELNVTPSAISQQIKNLESYVGLSLFSREQRVLTLTIAGEGFYKVAERTLRQYERGFSDFSDRYLSPSLKISMIPYMANEVVIPHLQEFQQAYPHIDLVIETSTQLEDLHTTELDGAIRFGIPPWGDLRTELISPVRSGLVASNDYIRRHPFQELSKQKHSIQKHSIQKHSIHSQDYWSKQTLIHSRRQVDDWQRYRQDIGFDFEPKQELYFDSYDGALRAAEEGLGIAIAGFPLSQHKLKSGDLSLIFDRSTRLKESLYLVTKDNESKSASYQCLLVWLQKIFKNS